LQGFSERLLKPFRPAILSQVQQPAALPLPEEGAISGGKRAFQSGLSTINADHQVRQLVSHSVLSHGS
jgi:hypothetical protein